MADQDGHTPPGGQDRTRRAPGGQERDAGGHPDTATLRAHLDDALDPADAAAVEAHLDDCDRCAAALEGLEPQVALGRVPEATWDERATHRAVRRTLLRTAVDVVAILGLVAIAVLLLSSLVWHPLVIDRGDRVERTVQASIDLPLLTVPGAQVVQWTSNADTWTRHTEVELTRPVGALDADLDDYETRLGPLSARLLPVGSPEGLGGTMGGGGTNFEPDRLGPGTAVTVHLHLDEPGLDLDDVDALAADTEEVALTWVGFAGGHPPVGYSACPPPELEADRVGPGGFGRTFGQPKPGGGGAHRALEEVRRALANLEASGLETSVGLATSQVAPTASAIAEGEPPAASVVLTGAVDEVAAIVDGTATVAVDLLAVDADVAPPTPCA